MPAPASKKPDVHSESVEPESPQKRGQVRRDGLVADEFDMDCWEPSLAERMRKLGGRRKS